MKRSAFNHSSSLKASMAEDQLMTLPKDLVVHIFTKVLPGEAIRACRRVCKTWRSFIVKHFGMINNHIYHGMVSDHGTRFYMTSFCGCSHLCLYSFNGCSSSSVEPMKIQFAEPRVPLLKTLVSYSNGLACILQCHSEHSKDARYDIILWNPFIHKIQFVSKSQYFFAGSVVGFGFIPQTMDYKVVKLVQYKKFGPVEVGVYSLISDSWETMITTGSTDCILPDPYVQSPNTFVQGCAHWIVNRRLQNKVILCFNMAEEVLYEIDMPPIKGVTLMESLTRFRDKLALFVSLNHKILEVWVMNDYGFADSWSRLYRLKDFDFFDDYEIMDNGLILQITRWGRYVYYDPVTEERTRIDVKTCA